MEGNNTPELAENVCSDVDVLLMSETIIFKQFIDNAEVVDFTPDGLINGIV